MTKHIARGSNVQLVVLTDNEDIHVTILPEEIAEQFPDDVNDLVEGLTKMGDLIYDDEGEDIYPRFFGILETVEYIRQYELNVVGEWSGVSY